MEIKGSHIISILLFYFFAVAVGWFSVLSWTATVSQVKGLWGGIVSRYNVPFFHQDTTDDVESQRKHSIQEYVNAILEPNHATVPRLKCPTPDSKRYNPIREPTFSKPEIDYIFAIQVIRNLEQLPTLLGAVVGAMNFLGPHRCALTIVSNGGRPQIDGVLEELRVGIEHLGAVYNSTFARGPRTYGHRNQAIDAVRLADKEVSEDATIVYLDDVDVCSEDLLELILQRKNLGADMTCGMRWSRRESSDTYIFRSDGACRDMQGDKFGHVKPEKWSEGVEVKEYFWKSPKDQARFNEKRPFQVFSCWGGVAAFTASTFTRLEQTFRLPIKGAECHQPDTRMFCKDMWSHGRGKIAVVPSVNIIRNRDGVLSVKESRGYTSDLVRGQDTKRDRIEWVKEPPKEVFCSKKRWEAWDVGLPLDDPWDFEWQVEIS
ncbi:hypothetical protein BHE90_003643 [Fusarium euwallaceae]|uniref:Uncharacterized protein n=1 Tax=Fusarium euwallaceae TaxID=1147111 RepID=A0A430M1T6_9HYPO|nr:hypothetical protein BHE90_003643 [Fusarium euwallaceae]